MREWTPTEEDCRNFPLMVRAGDCAKYNRAVAPERKKPSPSPVAVKSANAQPSTAAKPKKTAPPRAQNELERSGHAARPLFALPGTPPARAIPGRTAEERLHTIAGHLLLTGFAGRRAGDPDVELVERGLREGKFSGVIVGDSNVESFRQLSQLLLTFTGTQAGSVPLIAIDQPGGPDTVLAEEKGFAFYGSANSLSGSFTPYEAQLIYRSMATELALLGVNLNIGPSEDVCSEDGVNLSALCFGTAPERVSAFSRAFNFGHHDRGVLAALRHIPFRPGLRSSWRGERVSSALLHMLVKSQTSDAIVIRFKALEPMPLTRFASGSKFAARAGRAKTASGEDSAVIFELDMGPPGAPIRYEEAILRAFQAGADMILVRYPASLPRGIYDLCLDAVRGGLRSGRLTMARLEEAYWRVQRLKDKLRVLPSRTLVARLSR
jgi:beta-N-acetylhexosaminidase